MLVSHANLHGSVQQLWSITSKVDLVVKALTIKTLPALLLQLAERQWMHLWKSGVAVLLRSLVSRIFPQIPSEILQHYGMSVTSCFT